MFQSTLPTRAATDGAPGKNTSPSCFNPRCPRGQRLLWIGMTNRCTMFQSTLPTRAATAAALAFTTPSLVSIHAAHAGSDCCRTRIYNTLACFNPRCPRGQRPVGYRNMFSANLFQSTLPTRAATPIFAPPATVENVSIHAAHAGSDNDVKLLMEHRIVSIHAAHAGSDFANYGVFLDSSCFNPRCPRGQRQGAPGKNTSPSCFNPRCPRGQRRRCFREWNFLSRFQSTLPTRAAT